MKEGRDLKAVGIMLPKFGRDLAVNGTLRLMAFGS